MAPMALRFILSIFAFMVLTASAVQAADIALLRRQAEQGNAAAQNDLGIAYESGDGVAQDFAEAVKWFRKSAEQGNATARYNLGAKYANGQGVAKDTREALKWYRAAATLGYGRGFYNVAAAYFNGQDVARDLVIAAALFDVAATTLPAENAVKAASNRDTIMSGLSPDQTRQARDHAQQCRDSKFRQCVGLADDGKSVSPPVAPGVAATGSAFFINGDGYLVTVAHVVGTCSSIRAPKVGALQRVAVDTQSDLAILKAPAKPGAFARLHGGKPVRPGDSVVTVGFPYPGALRSGPTVTTGVIAALSGLYGDRRFLQMTAPVQHGNSGGPLLGANGGVVGVADAGLMSNELTKLSGDLPQSVNFAVTGATLRAYLESNRVRFETASGEGSQSAADIAEQAMKYTVLVECLG
jgi:S1-C subfamily serine protease